MLQKQQKDAEFKAQEEARLKSEEDARKLAAVQAINKKLEDDKLLALMTAAQSASNDGKSGANKKQDLDLLKKMAKDHLDQAALQRAVQEKVIKAKEEETKRRVDQARRVEYLVRALREAEKPKLDSMISSTMDEDSLYVTQFHANNLERKRAIYEAAMKVKSRIARMVVHADAFEEAVLVKRREAYEKVKVSIVFLFMITRSYKRSLKKCLNSTCWHPRMSPSANSSTVQSPRCAHINGNNVLGTKGLAVV